MHSMSCNMPASFQDVVRFMKDIATQFSDTNELYKQCNIHFERSTATVLLAVDVLDPMFEPVELSVSKCGDTLLVNGYPVTEELSYNNIMEEFKHLHISVYNTLGYLHSEEKAGVNWSIKYDKKRNFITVTDKSTKKFLFRITFTPYNRLNEPILIMACLDDTKCYERFQSYVQLAAMLKSTKKPEFVKTPRTWNQKKQICTSDKTKTEKKIRDTSPL